MPTLRSGNISAQGNEYLEPFFSDFGMDHPHDTLEEDDHENSEHYDPDKERETNIYSSDPVLELSDPFGLKVTAATLFQKARVQHT